MGWLALGMAVCAGACVALPGALYAGMGLAIAAVGAGAVAYRRRDAPGRDRLAGAGAIAVGAAALIAAALRYGVTLAAIDRLRDAL